MTEGNLPGVRIYLVDATEHADYGQDEAWVVVAHTPLEAWGLIQASSVDLSNYPIYVEGYESGFPRSLVAWRRPATIDDMNVEVLGVPEDPNPRVLFTSNRGG